MPCFICQTCGSQFSESSHPPPSCLICEDERQYVPREGQQWTTLLELAASHHNEWVEEEPSLLSVHTEPKFAIGERALLVKTPEGNLLSDCISLLDEPTIARVRAEGGLRAIAISHPHYYTTMAEWSLEFGGAPIYLHADDRQWVMWDSPAIVQWQGETLPLFGGLTLQRCGGHFDGCTVLHWPQGGHGRGALLTGDTIQVASDKRTVSCMYSYPNYIPLSASKIQRIAASVEPYAFERIYGAFPDLNILQDGKEAVRRSLERYVQRINEAG